MFRDVAFLLYTLAHAVAGITLKGSQPLPRVITSFFGWNFPNKFSLSMTGTGCKGYLLQAGFLRGLMRMNFINDTFYPDIVTSSSAASWLMAGFLFGDDFKDEEHPWNAPFGEYCEALNPTDECLGRTGKAALRLAEVCDSPLSFDTALQVWWAQQTMPGSGGLPALHKDFLHFWSDYIDYTFLQPNGVDGNLPFSLQAKKRWPNTEWVPTVTVAARNMTGDASDKYPMDEWQSFGLTQNGDPYSDDWMVWPLKKVVGASSNVFATEVLERMSKNLRKKEIYASTSTDAEKAAGEEAAAERHLEVQNLAHLAYQNNAYFPYAYQHPWYNSENPGHDVVLDGCGIDNTGLLSAIKAIERKYKGKMDQAPKVHMMLIASPTLGAGDNFRFWLGQPSRGVFGCSKKAKALDYEFFNSDKGKIIEPSCGYPKNQVPSTYTISFTLGDKLEWSGTGNVYFWLSHILQNAKECIVNWGGPFLSADNVTVSWDVLKSVENGPLEFNVVVNVPKVVIEMPGGYDAFGANLTAAVADPQFIIEFDTAMRRISFSHTVDFTNVTLSVGTGTKSYTKVVPSSDTLPRNSSRGVAGARARKTSTLPIMIGPISQRFNLINVPLASLTLWSNFICNAVTNEMMQHTGIPLLKEDINISVVHNGNNNTFVEGFLDLPNATYAEIVAQSLAAASTVMLQNIYTVLGYSGLLPVIAQGGESFTLSVHSPVVTQPTITKQYLIDQFFHVLNWEGMNFMRVDVLKNPRLSVKGGWSITLLAFDVKAVPIIPFFLESLPQKFKLAAKVHEFPPDLDGYLESEDLPAAADVTPEKKMVNHVSSHYTTWLMTKRISDFWLDPFTAGHESCSVLMFDDSTYPPGMKSRCLDPTSPMSYKDCV